MIRVLTVRSKRLLSFLFEKICNVAAVFEKQKIKQLSIWYLFVVTTLN